MILAARVDDKGEFTDLYWGEHIVIVDEYDYVFKEVSNEIINNIANYKIVDEEIVQKLKI